MCAEFFGGIILIVVFVSIGVGAIAEGHILFGVICFGLLGVMLIMAAILHMSKESSE